jgi:hypothetical protein
VKRVRREEEDELQTGPSASARCKGHRYRRAGLRLTSRPRRCTVARSTQAGERGSSATTALSTARDFVASFTTKGSVPAPDDQYATTCRPPPPPTRRLRHSPPPGDIAGPPRSPSRRSRRRHTCRCVRNKPLLCFSFFSSIREERIQITIRRDSSDAIHLSINGRPRFRLYLLFTLHSLAVI